MFRRCVMRMCEGGRAELPGGMTLVEATLIFGFNPGEKLEKPEIKKRYAKLALKHHPDRGGTSEQFQKIVAAQKVLLSARHDSHKERKEPTFKKHTPHQANVKDSQEMRQDLSKWDMLFFITIVSSLVMFYAWKTFSTHTSVLRKRRNLLPEDVKEIERPKKAEHVWHPWHSDSELRSLSEEVAVLQGTMRREVLEEKRHELDYLQGHPLAPARYYR